jgi:AraC-like DNA-binding protein/quercetin dioxygenase-like cupin family protein
MARRDRRVSHSGEAHHVADLHGARHDPRGRGDARITTLTWRYDSGHQVPEHFHDDDQLVYAVRGVMTVRAEGSLWVVPTRRAVWIPAGVAHAIAMSGTVEMQTLYLAPGLATVRACAVLHVTSLLEALVVHACRLGKLHADVPREAHLVAVITDEIDGARSMPLQLPSPCDPRAARIARRLLADPGDGRTLAELSRGAGASKRTIERLFLEETGMTFGKWRQQLSLLHGTRLLAEGAKVTSAALQAGYGSPSAFIAVFRKALGMTPSQWRSSES